MSSFGGPNIVTTANATTTVSSVAALQTAINNASSGDVLVLANGVYLNNTLSINKSNITVKAANSGGVFLNGTNDITISGSNVIFSGFQFTSGDIGTATAIEVIGSYNVVTQLNFSDYYAAKYIRIKDGSQYNQITFCNFQKKPADAQIGCTIQISTSPTVPGYHKISYCSFQNYYGVGGDNGNEPVRIGLSSERDNVSRTVVEKCYFNNTGLGDGETVSIKSAENIVRFCTFTNQQNANLSFRNGPNNVAYSNFFINAGGIKIKEANNIYCYNNYFYNSVSPVSLVYISGSIYANILNNINFIHNTFVECSNPIDLGGTGVTNNTWANNIFKRSSGSIFSNANTGTTWSGNISSGNLGITITSGVTNIDPLLTINSDGYYGLSSTSPAIGGTSSSYPSILNITNVDDDPTLAFDISGQTRPTLSTSKDIGADQYTTGATTNRPLAVNNVGPNYLGGPSVVTGLVLHLDATNVKSFRGEPTVNIATGTMTPYDPYNTMTRNGQNFTFTMVGGSALYLTVNNGVDYGLVYGGATLAFSGYMFKNGLPHTLPYNKANTYHTATAKKWYFDSLTGYFEIIETFDTSSIWLFHTPSGAVGGDIITINNFQIEVKGYVTPFVNGTRGATIETGGGWLDISGNTNHGQLLNGPLYNSLKKGSIVFDGVNDYTNFGNILNYTSEDFSFNYWIYVTSLTTNVSGSGPVIIFKGGYQTNGYYDQIGANGLLFFGTNTTGSTITTSTAVGTISEGNTYNICYTRSGSSVRIYVNGLDATNSAGTHINPFSSNSNFTLASYGGSYLFSNIRLYSFTSYNRKLSAKEVLQNFNATRTRYNITNWNYDSSAYLPWSDDTTGYTLLTGGVTSADDGYWNNPITIPTYYINNQTSTSLYISTNAVVTLGSGYDICCPSSPQDSSNPALISGNAGDMYADPGQSLSDGTIMNAYYKIKQNGDKIKIELKVFQTSLDANPAPYSYQLNLYRDSTYQWIETRVKSNTAGTVGPYNLSDVSQPASTVSGVWRGDLLGQNWVYLGSGIVIG